jgi:hypothetical protein
LKSGGALPFIKKGEDYNIRITKNTRGNKRTRATMQSSRLQPEAIKSTKRMTSYQSRTTGATATAKERTQRKPSYKREHLLTTAKANTQTKPGENTS